MNLMEMFIRATLLKANSMDKESTTLPMQEKHMKENLIQIIFRDQVR